MRVRILGTAAGGGCPQWNCGCANCRQTRQESNGPIKGFQARNQAQIAVTSDGEHWFLLNASPDLRQQIELFSALHPRSLRDSPISGVVLTCAELDAVLGLLLMRESQPLRVYAAQSARRVLTEDNTMFAMLRRVPDQLRWHDIRPCEPFELRAPDGTASGIQVMPIAVPSGYPQYVDAQRASELRPDEAVLGLQVTNSESGKSFVFLPGTPQIEDAWLPMINQSEVLLLDGTFWTDDELIRLQGHGRTARGMGHVPVSGEGGSIDTLRAIQTPRKLFIHINNTNPMLDGAGPEYAQVRQSGWGLAQDGMEFEL